MDANRIYATGGFLDVLAFRLREIPLIASLHAFVFLRTIGLFLVGALAWRSGIVQNARGLFVIALPAIGLGAALLYRGIEPLGTILLALGYGAAILGIAQFRRGKKLLGWAAPLGRMAFTNYVAQSSSSAGSSTATALACSDGSASPRPSPSASSSTSDRSVQHMVAAPLPIRPDRMAVALADVWCSCSRWCCHGWRAWSDQGPSAVIARSTCDEAIQTASAERFWIASLRSQ